MSNPDTSELLLKNIVWTCSACGLKGCANTKDESRSSVATKDLIETDFGIRADKKNSVSWEDNYCTHILAPGNLRRCRYCRGDYGDETGSVACKTCDERDPRKFSRSMLHNSGSATQSTQCAACTNPPCSSKHCKTCRQCHDPACRKGAACTDDPVPLHPKGRPKTKLDWKEW